MRHKCQRRENISLSIWCYLWFLFFIFSKQYNNYWCLKHRCKCGLLVRTSNSMLNRTICHTKSSCSPVVVITSDQYATNIPHPFPVAFSSKPQVHVHKISYVSNQILSSPIASSIFWSRLQAYLWSLYVSLYLVWLLCSLGLSAATVSNKI